MVFWHIYLNDKPLTTFIRQFINTIKIKYELSKAPTAQIFIESNSYLDGLFTEGQKIKIDMGYFPHELVTMIEGRVIKLPEGSASEFLTYTINIAGEIIRASYNTKIQSFKNPTKYGIISELIVRNGYIPFIDIDDKGVIPANQNPLQKNKTDLEYMTECAKRWRCEWWVDQEIRTIYFMDFKKAHDKGSTLKKANRDDKATEYLLGYRTNNLLNNVAKISWKTKPIQGSPTIAQTPKKKVVEGEELYEFYDMTFKMRPETVTWIEKKGFDGASLIFAHIASAKTNEEELKILKTYFVLYPANQGTVDTDKQVSRNSIGIELEVELNKADFYLRPPRTALLKAGTANPKTKASHLPPFLVSDTPRKCKINIVELTYASGYAKSMLKMQPA